MALLKFPAFLTPSTIMSIRGSYIAVLSTCLAVGMTLCTGRTAVLSLSAIAAESRAGEPFGLDTYDAPEGPLWIRWRTLETEIRAEALILASCRADPLQCGSAAASRFLAIIDDARVRQGRARLGSVNSAINLSIRWTDDVTQHGVPELWTSPLASLAAGRGDCMDFAIAKYVALSEAGVPANDLRILIVWDASVKDHHALVAARQDEHWLILDNRSMVLMEDSAHKSLVPLFSIGHAGVKQFHPPAPPGGFKLRDKLADAPACLASRG